MTPFDVPGVREEPSPRLPRAYLWWPVGSRLSLLGDSTLSFALGWAAGAHGAETAALVLTAVTLPRSALLLIGGVVGDRFGARRVMLVGVGAMLAVTLAGLASAPLREAGIG